ncbi:Basic secretory protease (Fragments) [Linum perenne]
MYAATRFVWVLFNQTDDPTQRKNITQIDLFIDNMGRNNTDIATTNNASIHVNANFIGNYAANLRRQFNGIMYQEVAGIWQWDARGQAPAGLVTGIANYVRLQARYGTVEKVKPGEGERWDQGNGVTAKFLSYCNQLKRGFVGELNNKMRNGYSDGFFLDLLGKTVDHLWSDYRESYGL